MVPGAPHAQNLANLDINTLRRYKRFYRLVSVEGVPGQHRCSAVCALKVYCVPQNPAPRVVQC